MTDEEIYEEILEEERDERDEEQAEELRQMRADDMYDSIRDENSILLMESVKELIEKAKNMMYYKNRGEGLAKDIIQNTLRELDFKIEEVNNITENFQDIRLVSV